MSFKFYVFLFTIFTILIPAAQTVEATCGLHACPIPVAVKGSPALTSFPSQASVETVYTSFNIGGKGGYLLVNATGIYEHRLFRLGAVLPIVYLANPAGDKSVGLANPLPYAEFYLISDAKTRLSVGSQFEIPLSNTSKGFGEDHFMLIPYVNLWHTIEAWRFAAQVGYMQAIGGHPGADVVYVNPHSDSEFVTRLMASYTWLDTWTAELNAGFRQVVDHDAVGDKTYLDLGTALRAQIANQTALRGGVTVPVTSTQRTLFQAFVGVYYYF